MSIGSAQVPFHSKPVHELPRSLQTRFTAFKSNLWEELTISLRKDWHQSIRGFAWHVLYLEIEGLVEDVSSGHIKDCDDFFLATMRS